MIKRRQVITGLLGLTSATMVSRWPDSLAPPARYVQKLDPGLPLTEIAEIEPLMDREAPIALAQLESTLDHRDSHTMAVPDSPVEEETGMETLPKKSDRAFKLERAAIKSLDFARDYADDVFVSAEEMPVLEAVFLRLGRVQKTIGYGNFNVLGFDDALTFSRRFEVIGEFAPVELRFIEKLFSTDAEDYGFFGEKVSQKLTERLGKSQITKIPGSGHYLINDGSLAYYQKVRQQVGDSIILTSGIRSNVKQLYLFVAKAMRVNGNLSRASRSLAPPGYSFHGIGDFDVGRVGWGAKNFTDDFAETDEFKRMQDLGYVAIRYDQGNKLGVRFEPWHIKVV